MRIARLAHLALGLACLLAVTGSVGLHPEPDGAAENSTVSLTGIWKTPQPPGASSHGCLACLAHRSVPLTRLAGVVLAPVACVGTLSLLPTPHLSVRASAPHEGRAPPISS
ncbi:MAG TPA: hypothetical protein VF376_04280 [Thermoanaerobaculia bacterium]